MRAALRSEVFGGLSYRGLSLRDMMLLWALLGLFIAVLVACIVSNSKAGVFGHSEVKSWLNRGLFGKCEVDKLSN